MGNILPAAAILLLLSGCGAMRQAEIKKQNDAIRVANQVQFASIEEACKLQFASPILDPIKDKVQLYIFPPDSAVPFSYLSNSSYATEADRQVIVRWTAARDECQKSSNDYYATMPKPSDVNLNDEATTRSFFKRVGDQVNDLILLLYNDRMTYGEFAKKRHEVSVDALEHQRAWIRTLQIANQAQREREQQLAIQQQAANAQTWAAYMNSQGVTCTSTRFGNMATTSCR